MKFMSWNIDGAKQAVNKGIITSLLLHGNADIYAFQETKVGAPFAGLEMPGYNSYWSFCEKNSRYSGTVCLTKKKPKKVTTDIGDPDFDTEGRIITLEFEYFFFVNCYVPNSQDEVAEKDSIHTAERKEYRRLWDEKLRAYLNFLDERKPVIVGGDFNAAAYDIDMMDRSRWREDGGFTKNAGENLRKLMSDGFIDSFRELYPDKKGVFTCWNIRDRERINNTGRRIDYFFVSDALRENISDSMTHPATMGSDHCPITLYMDMPEITRIFYDVNLDYSELRRREKTGAYFRSLQNVILSNVWETVDWGRASAHLLAMQKSLAKVAYSRDPEAIRELQWRIVTSLDAKLLAVKSVCSGKGQPGVDKVRWSTPHEKALAAISLTSKEYHAKPAHLVIQENDNGKDRPIHIDTYYDRAMQTLYGYSLAPVAESWSDRKSFSARKGRSPLDVNYFITKIFTGAGSPKWAYKADVKKFYESIDHDWIRENIPLAKNVLEQFIGAGYIFSQHYYETEEGIGIGSRLSHLIANMALDGLQDYIYDHLYNAGEEIDYNNGNVIRFADDIIVTARDRETALYIGNLIYDFVSMRRLSLNDEKSYVINADDGFDFLKRHYELHGKIMTGAPSKVSVNSFKQRIEKLIMSSKCSQEELIDRVNKKIIGFVSYHKVTDAERVFRDLDVHIRICLFRRCRASYPKYDKERIFKEFWFTDEKGRECFAIKGNEKKRVIFMADTIMTHYYPIDLNLNPYIDIEKIDEIKHLKEIENVTGVYKKIWNRQEGRCQYCGEAILRDDMKELVEINPGEATLTGRMAYIHSRCRDLTFEYVYEDEDEGAKDDTMKLLIEESSDYSVEDIKKNPLFKFFEEQERATVTLSFKKIGEILGDPLLEIADSKEFWFETDRKKICAAWLDNDYFVKKVSLEGRKFVSFHKYNFIGETARAELPDLLLYGKLPVRVKTAIENYVRYQFEEHGIPWK